MRMGLIAFADNTGLGTQTKAYYDHLEPYRTMVLDRTNAKVGHRCYPERYPDAWAVIPGLPTFEQVEAFLAGLDVVLMAETAPTQHLLRKAHEIGVKTVVVPNWEYYHNFQKPKMPHPDLLAAPSMWHYHDYPDPKTYLPFPIDRQTVQNTVDSVHNFVHIAGRPIYPDRNGTRSVLEALQFIKATITLTIFCQDPGYLEDLLTTDYPVPANVSLQIKDGTETTAELYAGQHVMIMPRRFGGLCLPVNEALGYGMPVIMPDISPNNEWLPDDWLVRARVIDQRQMANVIDIYDVYPEDLAAKIDQMADQKFFMQARADAFRMGVDYGWPMLKGRYIETLSSVV